MADNSKISWTDSTFNPWVGCTKVSQGCKNCYAETMMDQHYKKAQWGPQGTRVPTSEAYWRKPLTWNKEQFFECACGWRGGTKAVREMLDDGRLLCPVCASEVMTARRRVFCASLADVFEGPETMSAAAWAQLIPVRKRLFALIEQTPNLDWLLLTKRPENVMTHFGLFSEYVTNLPGNVWIGTTVEDQQAADRRIPELLRIPAKRFLSCEPLLGPVDLHLDGFAPNDLGYSQLTAGSLIHWVIAGGESGANARPARYDWAVSLLEQCLHSRIPFHWKQWGEWLPVQGVFQAGAPESKYPVHQWDEHEIAVRMGKHLAGRTLEGRVWNGFPEV